MEQIHIKETNRPISEKLKYILYWNEAYGANDYGFCCGHVTTNFKLYKLYLLPTMCGVDIVVFLHYILKASLKQKLKGKILKFF